MQNRDNLLANVTTLLILTFAFRCGVLLAGPTDLDSLNLANIPPDLPDSEGKNIYSCQCNRG